MATIKKPKKAQNGATADSSSYFTNKRDEAKRIITAGSSLNLPTADQAKAFHTAVSDANSAEKARQRQKYKGKPGFDANGFPAKELKKGGKITKKK